MKKLIFMFLAILLCGIVQAQTSEIILKEKLKVCLLM